MPASGPAQPVVQLQVGHVCTQVFQWLEDFQWKQSEFVSHEWCDNLVEAEERSMTAESIGESLVTIQAVLCRSWKRMGDM